MKKIDVRDLWVGNWVKFNKAIRQIEATDFVAWKSDGMYSKEFIECNPIPLTEKMLKKNGFAEDYDSEYDMSYTFEIPHPTGGASVEVTLKHNEDDAEWVAYLFGSKGEVNELTINYVHELQHALRLLGIEKEITI